MDVEKKSNKIGLERITNFKYNVEDFLFDVIAFY
jgi:hypothetical protein